MTIGFMSRASAAFMLFVAAAAGQAQAQTHGSAGALRFGAFVQASQFDGEVSTIVAPGTRLSGVEESDTFFGGGISVGYDWAARQGLVLGLEGDAAVDESNTEYLLTLRGRVGANLQPGWLIYATGGVALLSIDELEDDFMQQGLHLTDDSVTGWTLGGGTEIDLHQFTLFAEFLHLDFESLDGKGHDVLGPGTVIPVDVDVDEQVFRFGAKFKLGADGARKSLK